MDVVAHHCREDGEELPDAGDDGDLLLFAGGDEALVEGSNERVVAGRRDRSHVQDRAYVGSPASDRALTFESTAVPVERGDADESRDLLAIEPAELRQLDENRSGADGTNALDRSKEVLFLSP
jgi:hypothetical protein